MEKLTPRLTDISQQGLNICCDLTAEEVGLSEGDAKVAGLLAVNLDLVNLGPSIYLTGVLEGTILRQCVRCLKEYEDPLGVALSAEYARQEGAPIKQTKVDSGSKKQRKEAERQPEDEPERDEDIYIYQGDHLELAPMLREQLILAAPMQALCQKNCRGLCPQCGQDLNERRCACEDESLSTPFKALQELRDSVRRRSES